jgi:hypothetical protein
MDEHRRTAMNEGERKRKRLPPVRIPLPFEQAVEGLLAVDPKKPVAPKPPKKKPRRKK